MAENLIDNIDIRSKLIVNCPDFVNQAEVNRIDFGQVFLSSQQEIFINQAQNIVNDGIDIINGVQNYITPETLEAVQNLITFIITDLIQTVIGYCTNAIKTYISPEFPLGLAEDLLQKTAYYTKKNIINPADLLKELTAKNEDTADEKDKKQSEELKNELMSKVNGSLNKTTAKIKKIMDEIQPYSREIAKYMKYGPDYAITQVEAIYKKYLNMGIGIVDFEIAKLNQELDAYIDFAGKTTGEFAAKKVNDLQEKQLKKVINATNKTKQKITLKAIALVNKVTMNLMGLLGG